MDVPVGCLWQKPNTMTDLVEILRISEKLVKSKIDRNGLLCLLEGFRIITNIFAENDLKSSDFKIAASWFKLFVRVQHFNCSKLYEHTLISKNMPTALTYMFGLLELAPEDQSMFFSNILCLTQQSVKLCDEKYFQAFTNYKKTLKILWNVLRHVGSFEMQVAVLQLFRLIFIKLKDVDFLRSEVQKFPCVFAAIKEKILKLQETFNDDERFQMLSREISNGICLQQGNKSLVRSFYCGNFNIGEKMSFFKSANTQHFWFNINTYPFTLTFDGIFSFNSKNDGEIVYVSLPLKGFSRQQNILHIKFKPPAKIWGINEDIDELDTATDAYAKLSESEMKRFLIAYKVTVEKPTPPSLQKEVYLDAKKLKTISDLNLSQQSFTRKTKNDIEKKKEIKVPNLNLYEDSKLKEESKKLATIGDQESKHIKIKDVIKPTIINSSKIQHLNQQSTAAQYIAKNKQTEEFTKTNNYTSKLKLPNHQITTKQTPSNEKRFFKHPRTPKAITLPWKSSSFKVCKRLLKKPGELTQRDKKVQKVKPIKVQITTPKVDAYPISTISNAQSKRNNVQIQANVVIKRPRLQEYSHIGYYDGPSTSQQAETWRAQNANKEKTIKAEVTVNAISTEIPNYNPLTYLSNYKNIIKNEVSPNKLDTKIEYQEEFSDVPSPEPLDNVINLLNLSIENNKSSN